jgi:hypothetical protein
VTAGMSERAVFTAEVLVVEDCPSQPDAVREMAAALEIAGLQDVPVLTVVVTSPEQAADARFAGSPSFYLNGRDLFPAAATGGRAATDMSSLSCRMYSTAAGLAGLPEQDALVTAVAARIAVASPGGER